MMVGKKTQSKVEGLRCEIEELQAELQKLEESRRVRAGEIEALEAEQRGHVVSARVHKNPGAQSNIERLAGDIAKRRTDDVFDCAAIAEIIPSSQAKKDALRRAQWLERCAPLRHSLQSRAAGALEGRALELALELEAVLGEIKGSNGKIIGELRSIHPLLLPLAAEVGSMGERIPDIMCKNLEPHLPNPFNRYYLERIPKDPQEGAVRTFKRVLEKLDALMETEQPAAV